MPEPKPPSPPRRPKDHDSALPWPPKLPTGANAPPELANARELQAAFSDALARHAFGSPYIDSLRRRHVCFVGDLWLLALLWRCVEIAAEDDPEGSDPDRFRWWNWASCQGWYEAGTKHLSHADFNDTDLRHADLSRSLLIKCTFERGLLDDAKFVGSEVTHSRFTNASAHRSSFVQGGGQHVNFEGASLIEVDFTKAHFPQATFDRADCTEADMIEIDLSSASLQHVNANAADLRGCKLNQAKVRHATLHSANLTGARCEHMQAQGACFANANLCDASLSAAYLHDADLNGADLRRSQLSNVKIARANLRRVRGLFGHDRALATHPIEEYESQNAIYRYQWEGRPETWEWVRWCLHWVRSDWASWDVLGVIGRLRLTAVSYFGVALIIVYAGFAVPYNDWVSRARADTAGLAGPIDALSHPWQWFLAHVPPLPMPHHLGRQLIATILVAIAATIYGARCPNEVKEANEVRWTRAMGQPLWEYRSANWSDWWGRYTCLAFFAVGGVHSLWYLAARTIDALIALFAG